MGKTELNMKIVRFAGRRHCRNCSKNIPSNAYSVNIEPASAFGEQEVVFCINCSIEIGELGRIVEQDTYYGQEQ